MAAAATKSTDVRIVDVVTDTEYIKYRIADQVRRPRRHRRVALERYDGRGNPRRPPRQGIRFDADGQRLGLAHRQARTERDAGRDDRSRPAGWPTRPATTRESATRWKSRTIWPPVTRRLPTTSRGRRVWPNRCRVWPNWSPPVRSKRPFTTPTARRSARTPTTCLGRNTSTATWAYLDHDFAGEYLDQYTLRQPKPSMPLYHLIGALDPLTDADVATRINDGLPRNAGRVDHRRRPDASEDQAQRRQPQVGRGPRGGDRARGGRGAGRAAAAQPGATRPISTRSAPTCDYVLDFLAQVGERSPAALRAAPIYRAADASRPSRQSGKPHAPRGQDQAGGDRRIAGRLRELAVEPRAGLLGRGLEGLQGAQRGPADGRPPRRSTGCSSACRTSPARALRSSTRPAFRPGFRRSPPSKATAGSTAPAGNAGWADRFPSMFHVTDGTLGTAVLNGPGLGF